MNIIDIYIAIENSNKLETATTFIERYLVGFKEEIDYYEYPPYFGPTEFETNDYKEMLSYVLQGNGRYYRFYFENLKDEEIKKGMIFINKDNSIYFGVSLIEYDIDKYEKKLRNEFRSTLILICNNVLPPDNLIDFKLAISGMK